MTNRQTGGEIVGSGVIEEANARFHKGGQPLNVQAGKGLLFAALCVLDLCPPGLTPFVNRQSYNESNSPLCSFLPQGVGSSSVFSALVPMAFLACAGALKAWASVSGLFRFQSSLAE